MISTVSEATCSSVIPRCVECGALHGSPEVRRIIISCSGDLVRMNHTVSILRRHCIAYGLRLQVSKQTRLPGSMQSMQCSCMISAPADFISLCTNPVRPLQITMRKKVVEHGALYDVLNWTFGPSSSSKSPIIRRSIFEEYCGTFDAFGNLHEPGRGKGKVMGLWHAVAVPFPHFCQWKRVPACSRMWSSMWSHQTESFLPGLTFPWLENPATLGEVLA